VNPVIETRKPKLPVRNMKPTQPTWDTMPTTHADRDRLPAKVVLVSASRPSTADQICSMSMPTTMTESEGWVCAIWLKANSPRLDPLGPGAVVEAGESVRGPRRQIVTFRAWASRSYLPLPAILY
jgi:hypothetical protein